MCFVKVIFQNYHFVQQKQKIKLQLVFTLHISKKEMQNYLFTSNPVLNICNSKITTPGSGVLACEKRAWENMQEVQHVNRLFL